jgi:hypothetical protein
MYGADEFPDKTVDELREMDESDEHSLSDEDYEEMVEEYQDMREGAILLMQASALGEMLVRGDITLRQYVEMVETVEDIADEKGVTLP